MEGRDQYGENNPMQSSRRRPAFDQALDTSGKSGVIFQYSEIVPTSPLAPAGGRAKRFRAATLRVTGWPAQLARCHHPHKPGHDGMGMGAAVID
ncbi:hypothetical protein XH93_38060 [Bradyrhizobium sp. CCBAU 51753]|nr:hypothetical protein XH93_38060 [Bradyrhizobium sp. CCBAU 51753]